jgi:hypothetical protein
VLEIRGAAEMRVDLKEVLNPVPVVGLEFGYLTEYRTDPERRDAQAAQVADLAR